MKKTGSVLYKFFLELDMLIFIGALLGTGFVNIVLSKFQTTRPFYVQDATLWYKFDGNTIESWMLFVIHYWIFAPIIYAMEKARLDKEGNVSESRGKVLAGRLALGMLTCTMVNIFIVELSKGYVGRLRPSFAQACLDQAAPYSQEILSRAFLSDADCITNNKEALVDMRRSFPSGHASLGLGGAVYMQLCLTRFAQRADGEMKAMGLMVCGWVVTTFGFWVGASRVFDGAHHVGDVAVGFVVGIVAAAVHFWFVVGRNSIEEKAACAAGAGMVKAGKEQ